jgi:hypothetical protein
MDLDSSDLHLSAPRYGNGRVMSRLTTHRLGFGMELANEP